MKKLIILIFCFFNLYLSCYASDKNFDLSKGEYLFTVDKTDFYKLKDETGKYGITKENGEIIVPFRFDFILCFRTNNTDYKDIGCLVKENGFYKFYDIKNKKTENQKFLSYKELYTGPLNYRFLVSDKNGDYIYDAVTKEIKKSDFEIIQLYGAFNSSHMAIRKNNKYGIADASGNIIIETIYDNLPLLAVDFCIVEKDKKQGVISLETGKAIIPVKFKSITGPGITDNDVFPFIYTFIVTEFNDKKRIYAVNKDLFEYTEQEYDDIIYKPWNYIVKKDNKYGDVLLVNRKLKEVLPCEYDEIEKKFDNLYIVSKDNKYGIYNEQNKEILPVKYDLIKYIASDTFKVCLEGKCGTYDFERKKLSKLKYKDVLNTYEEQRNKNIGYETYKVVYESGKTKIIPEKPLLIRFSKSVKYHCDKTKYFIRSFFI